MKISLALGNPDTLNVPTARGCLATNLALPGFGTLVAGRPIGYVQATLTIIGFGLTLGFGLPGMGWMLKHWQELHDPNADPVFVLQSVWNAVRWALLGIGLFCVTWIWALGSSLAFMRAAKDATTRPKPPKL